MPGRARVAEACRRAAHAALLALLGCLCLAGAALAQQKQQPQQPSPFALDILRGALGEDMQPAKQAPPAQRGPIDLEGNPTQTGQVTMTALIAEDGARIEQGLVWRVYTANAAAPDAKPRLVATYNEPSPTARLAPGDYYVNVAFGRANLTRKITVTAGPPSAEQFPLNVGLLKVTAVLNNKPLPPGAVTIDVYSDERDQFGQRAKIVSGAHPGTMLRLNSGLYQIVSQYGDANAVVQADLTVEPGKLTDATVVHQAARITFKLVTRSGGEAIPDTQWSILNRQGDIVKESAGALPQHTLLPGFYTVSARSQGRSYRRTFQVKAGKNAEVEVLVESQ